MTTSPFGEHADVVALLWNEPSTPKRGPKPGLDLNTIAGMGIHIADTEGLSVVTMPRIAEQLGVTKMALYRYVPRKAVLVALMIDTALGDAPALHDHHDGWRRALHDWASALFDRFEKHPWLLRTTLGARVTGPRELGWMEQAVASLTGAGLDGGEALDVAATLTGHVRTIAAYEVSTPDEAPERRMASTLSALLTGREDRFPALTTSLESSATNGTQDQAFDFGLHRILDGVERLIDTRR